MIKFMALYLLFYAFAFIYMLNYPMVMSIVSVNPSGVFFCVGLV
jgi:hypothetical protein